MTFLQPTLLWILPAVLLPILIHLLNRLRYRSIRWAAMLFLVAANQSSTRRARLRQWLILLARVLALLLLVLALSRPIIGGWVGTRLAGAPDTILILLDRSASMETLDPRRMVSKRTQALSLFADAAETAGDSRFVLLDSALMTPHEIAGPEVLTELSVAGPTDTAADMPAMFRAALDYMVENRTGRTEIWVASDMQRTGWEPESGEWADLSERIAALPQDVRVRVLGMPAVSERNRSIALREVIRHDTGDRSSLAVAVEIESTTQEGGPFPLVVTLNGNRSQLDVEMTGQRLDHRVSIELGQERSGGWGKIEVPADENARDNACYFVYGERVPLAAAVVSEETGLARCLRLACAPDPDDTLRSAATWNRDALGDLPLGELALVVWQLPGATPSDTLTALETFVETGGTVLCLPSETAAPPPEASPFSIAWNDMETATRDKPYRVAVWDEHDGPLARTASGMDLPVAELTVTRRRIPASGTPGAADWYPVAAYDDGSLFLARRRMGRGHLYVCTTLPDADWSDLARGPVLVPMLQRLLYTGGTRLSSAENGICGEWSPTDTQEVWLPLEDDIAGAVTTRAGAYRSSARFIALNRPVSEDDPTLVSDAMVVGLLGDVRCQVLSDLAGRDRAALQSEIWHLFIYAALAFLLVESMLLLLNRRRPSESNPVPGRATA